MADTPSMYIAYITSIDGIETLPHPYRIVEMIHTIDGARWRVADRACKTFEQAQDYARSLQRSENGTGTATGTSSH